MTGRRAAAAAVLMTVLAGCSGGSEGGSEGGDTKASAGASAREKESSVARSGGSVGAQGSPCELPVTFDFAEDWEADAVDAAVEAGSEEAQEAVDALLYQGPVALVCELDAKPAGNIGFLRVWTGKPGETDAREVLEAFLAAENGAAEEKYGTFESNGLRGAEVTYLYSDELLEETKEERAVAVVTTRGPVVLHLGGLDTEEHRAMVPALELAKQTLRAAPEK
ncbi:lipoprotein [Streptomyces sp. NPDC048002]|uniref:lipoprotein n=1 Tax=Streptomyces sp. NPDC048002 TaxID=3154344 RepID=UPI0033E3D46B